MATTSSIASDVALKSCEIESCHRISATLCRHCNKNVCRRHFDEHADQLLQELNPLVDSFNELGQKISAFCVKEYKQKAFDKLMQWRDEAVQNINDLYELKKQKFDLLLQDNEKIFSQRTISHSEVVDTLKNETAALVKEGDVTFEQLQILKRKLYALDDSVNQTHSSLVYCDIKPLLVDYTLVLLHSEANNYMRGGTLLCADYQMKLNDFYGNAKQKWELIYKATLDGFRAQDFHRCCDSKGPTMTIIQGKNDNYLFGGYAEISWDCDNYYKMDPAAFLFTLTNPHGIQPTKFFRNSNENYSVVHSKARGPGFGGVVKDKRHFIDIQIYTNANENQDSNCSFPSTYIDTTGMGEILFTGTKNFMVEEIEVYKRLGGMGEGKGDGESEADGGDGGEGDRGDVDDDEE
ncbi:unnamed protein product [Didymodactylos carnosus]|uniref:TLDc domain-containing protein n=1 Tax=Didymodactylos carnosus TaxID=1234261 RepID=A0A814RVD1_9BILA|nr:unnamed protein product [Didymodactylos carnosus]CAF1137903.1 unnamed protein product [Didymodactylos carnosus]CAF3749287.1 unnamed protein product [Didymodactylos carnosus]CAF3901656.1 unnamed protein product [Didymodactylos carnosus]